MPDEEPLSLAEKGQLTNAAVRRKQVDRMLADSRSDAFVTNFAGQWLGSATWANPPAARPISAVDSAPGDVDRWRVEGVLCGVPPARPRCAADDPLGLRDDQRAARPVLRHSGCQGMSSAASTCRTGFTGWDRDAGVDPDHDVDRDPNLAREAAGTWILKTLLGTDPGCRWRTRARSLPRCRGSTRRRSASGWRFTVNCRSTPAATTRSTHSGSPSKTSTPHRKRGPAGAEVRLQGAKDRYDDDRVIDASSKVPDSRRGSATRRRTSRAAMPEDEGLSSLGCLSSKSADLDACVREAGLAEIR